MEGKEVSIAGRMMSRRIMGKASFAHIADATGKIQAYVKRDDVGTDDYADFKKWDIGDIIGITGVVFKTQTGETSIHANSIKHITCSHIGSNVETCEKAVAGEINITFVPQGSLCEKVRAGGAGIGGILTPTGVHTPIQEGKQLLEWDNEAGEYKFVSADTPQKGKRYILELPLHADVCFVHAYKADKMGNLKFHRTARNFNEIFATAADFVIVEAEHIVEVGELDPDEIMVPGALVDLIVQAEMEG